MNNDPTKRPSHQPDTFGGELFEFESEALSPDDPRLEPRVCKGRPADRKTDPRFDGPAEPNAE